MPEFHLFLYKKPDILSAGNKFFYLFMIKGTQSFCGNIQCVKPVYRNIKLPELPYYGIREGDVGYINLNSFTEGCAKDVRRALIDLKK